LKIKIVTPEEEQLDFNADYWEFSQNKFVNEDIVLVFYKNNIESTDKGMKAPSKEGVLITNILSQPLKNIIGEDRLNEERLKSGIFFLDNSKPFKGFSTKNIKTENYAINDDLSLNYALTDLLQQEKEVGLNYQVKIIKEPVVKFEKETFSIEEELSVGREEEIKV